MLNGTTAEVGWAQRTTEMGLDEAPGLADKVEVGVVKYVHSWALLEIRSVPPADRLHVQRKSSCDAEKQ